jgi:hypothetical protein
LADVAWRLLNPAIRGAIDAAQAIECGICQNATIETKRIIASAGRVNREPFPMAL